MIRANRLALLASLLCACCPSFKTITVDQFLERLEVGRYHSAFFFVYAGEDEGAYYFIEKWELRTYGYRVPRGQGLVMNIPYHAVDCELGEWSLLQGGEILIRGETMSSIYKKMPPDTYRSPNENRP